MEFAGNLLGLPYVPAYADPNTKGTRMLGGVNYASAAAGILDETGQHYVRTIYVLYEHYLTLYIIRSVYFIYMLMFNNLLNALSS